MRADSSGSTILGRVGAILAAASAFDALAGSLLLAGLRGGNLGASKRAKEGPPREEARFRGVFEGAAVGMAILDAEGRVVEGNRALREMLGLSEEEIRGASLAGLFSPGDGMDYADVIAGLAAGSRESHRTERRYAGRGEGDAWMSVTVSLLAEPGGEAVAVVEDSTRRKLAEEEAAESERRFRQLFDNSHDAMLVHDERGRVVDCNAEACRSLGYPREELIGLSVKDFVVDLIPEEERRSREDTPWRRAMRSASGEVVGFHENRHRRKDGTTFPVEVAISSMDHGGRRMIFAAARDISERKLMEEQLAHRAFHDFLTGLPNRALFMDRLEHALARKGRRGENIAILFMDLDDFKHVNDTWGHDCGDQVLVEVGKRLASCVRSADTVARLGGDEFTILLEDINDPEDVLRVTERIERALRGPIRAEGRDIHVTASIGVVPRVSPGSGPRDLLSEGDQAMYRAKKRGKNRHEIHIPEARD